MKQKRKTRSKNHLPALQGRAQEKMIHIPGALEEALNTGLNPVPKELGIKVVYLLWGRDKALGKAISKMVKKISMVLISKKGQGVKKWVILIQVTIKKDHIQQISQVVTKKGMFATQKISLSVPINTALTQTNLQEIANIRRNPASMMDSAQGAVEDKNTSQIQIHPLSVVMSLAQVSPLDRDSMNQMQDLNQETVKNKDIVLVQVRHLVMDHAQASLLLKEHMDLTQVVSQAVVKDKSMALDQGNPLIMGNMDLNLINLLVRGTVSLIQNPV